MSRKTPYDKAPGIDGIGPYNLAQAIVNSPRNMCAELGARIATRMSAGHFGRELGILTAAGKAVALNKDGSPKPDVRPVVMGLSMRKSLTKPIAQKVTEKIRQLTRDHQAGMLPAGFEAAVHLLRHGVHQCAQKGWTLLGIDFSNAFVTPRTASVHSCS